MSAPPKPPRYLFVGGLHRSGTSLTARLAASLPDAGGIGSAPVPEREGVYLQGGIPHDALSGRPMHFATDPAQHLTEDSPLNRLEVRDRIAADWAPWFAEGLAWRVEKSPVNLTRTRLIQQLFPLSQFVLVLRHPEAVAAAVAKWVPDPAPALLDHWLAAHDLLTGDLPRLHAALVLRYEDVASDPARTLRMLAAFCGTEAPWGLPEAVSPRNDDYAGATEMDAAQAAGAARWGYAPGLGALPWRPLVRHPLRAVREAVEAAWDE